MNFTEQNLGCVSIYIPYNIFRHSNPLPKGKQREGCLNKNVVKHSLNGFTKSTAVHNFGRQVDDLKTMKTLDFLSGKVCKIQVSGVIALKHSFKLF